MLEFRQRVAGALPLLLLGACTTGIDPALIESRTTTLYGSHELAPVAEGQEEAPVEAAPEGPADLEAWTRIALERHPGLRAAFERWRASVERVAQAEAMPDPQLGFEQFVEEIQTRTGPQQRRYSLSQAMPWFGKLGLRGDVARKESEVLWQQVLDRRLQVERDVALAFHEYAWLGTALRITRQNLELLRSLEPVVRSRIQGGGGQQELLQLQVEVGKLENDEASLVRRQPAVSARLERLLGRRGRGTLPLPVLVEPTIPDLAQAELILAARVGNPGLRALRETIDRHRLALDLAGLAGAPDLVVGVDYFETGPAINPSTPGSGDDPWGVRLQLSLPIQRGRIAAAETEAEHSLSAARLEFRDRLLSLEEELAVELFQLDDARRSIALFRDSLLPRAREALEVGRASYRAGKASLIELIDSERSVLAFELSYWRACRDAWQSRARIQALAGAEEER